MALSLSVPWRRSFLPGPLQEGALLAGSIAASLRPSCNDRLTPSAASLTGFFGLSFTRHGCHCHFLLPPAPGAKFAIMTRLAALPERGVIEVGGEDRIDFLQGLISNDVTLAAPGQAVWAALLTPQGKYLADFFILADADRLLLDCERAQIPMLLQRLSRFRLRSKVALRVVDDLSVYAAWDGAPTGQAIAAPDPRLPAAGWRVLSATPLPTTALQVDWDRHRLALGLPDGSRDLEAEKSVLLEAGFDELNGVSWTKGCYMGQELTARTKYRGLVKRRLVPVTVAGSLPAARHAGAARRRRGGHDALGARSVGHGRASARRAARHADMRRRDAGASPAGVDGTSRGGGMSRHENNEPRTVAA